MTGRPWWQDAVVYQIYPRSFCDTDGDGVGDLEGVRRRVAYLRDLGVDAVWLSPFYPSPMADFGYDVADYCGVDPVFGTLADFDRLVTELHDAGLRVLLDWIPNHTSDRHPWFVDARSSRGAEHRDWYLWRDDRPDGAGGSGPPGSPGRRPNNWRASFPGVGRRGFPPAWTWDEGSRQWYLHLFLPEQPDLNWRNPAVREAMAGTLRFWLDRGVDGFRVDAVHTLGKDPALPDLPEAVAGLPASASNDRPETHDILAELRQAVDGHGLRGGPAGGRPLLVGEVFLLSTDQVAPYYGSPERPELDLAFNFEPLFAPWDAAEWRRRIERTEAVISPVGWPTWVLSNHDVGRHRSRYGTEARARAAALLLTCLRGTPFLYAGEELGLEDADIPAQARVDPGGRDGCRAPLPWTHESGHGWAPGPDGTVRPWLPWPPGAGADRNVAAQEADPASMLHLYRRLLATRRRSPALRRGSWEPLDAAEGVLAFRRRHAPAGQEPDERVVVVNFTERERPLPAISLGEDDWAVEVSSAGGWSPARRSRAGVPDRLAPDEAVVLAPAPCRRAPGSPR